MQNALTPSQRANLIRKIQVTQEIRRRQWPSNRLIWVQDVWRPRGEPLDFDNHFYLVQLYQEDHPNIVVQKSAQTGLSENFITESIWLPDQHSYSVGYYYPTKDKIGAWARERIDDPVAQSDYLLARVDTDNVRQKKVGDGWLYLLGSNSIDDLKSFAMDCVIIDEWDDVPQWAYPYYEKRLGHSALKWMRRGSTPTYPEVGIHALFLQSDQYYYHVKCEHCNERQVLDFWENVDVENAQIVCRKCRKSLNPIQKGEWVAKYPSRSIRGYHISKLYSPRLDLSALIENSKKTAIEEVQQFYNQDLGIPYEPKGARLTDTVLNSCKRNYTLGEELKGTHAGVDVGVYLHVIVSREIEGKTRYVYIGKLQDFMGERDSLEWLLNTYDIKTMVVDIMPETRKVLELIEKYPGRVFGCRYPNTDELANTSEYLKWNDEEGVVSAHRTISLDFTLAEFERQQVELPKNAREIPDFYREMKAPIRVKEKNARGQEVARYISSGPDHFAHSANYERIARQRFTGGSLPRIEEQYRVRGETAGLIDKEF